MANGQGGKRTPGNPAPVSGPGQLSRRTDGGPQQTQATMTGMPYGENAEFNTMQSQAPMSAAGQTAARGSRQAKANMPSAKPLFSPTERPDEPVTAGAPFGPGDGPPATNPGMGSIIQDDARILSRYLPDLMKMASDPTTPDGFRRFVRHLRNVQSGY